MMYYVSGPEEAAPIIHDLDSTIYPADMIQRSEELGKESLPVHMIEKGYGILVRDAGRLEED